MKKWQFNLIVIGTISLATLGIAGGIVLKSRSDYQKYYDENYPEIDPADYATMIDMKVELKGGVKYYKNNKAAPKPSDFVVTGIYQPKKDDQPVFEQVLKYEKRPYIVSVGPKFAFEGGDITVSYGAFSKSLTVGLLDYVLENIKIEKTPYVTVYQVGQIFDDTGMVVTANYNNGHKEVISKNDYVISNLHALTTDDKDITVSYNGKSVKLPITVVNSLVNGRVISIFPEKEYFEVNKGDDIASKEVHILARYESGNIISLSSSLYTLNRNSVFAKNGNFYSYEALLKTNPDIKCDVRFKVHNRIESEYTKIVGGRAITEKEYKYKNGSYSLVGDVTFAGDFQDAVNGGSEAYISFDTFAYADSYAELSFKISNTLIDLSGLDDYYMKPLQINSVMDLVVNDEIVPIDDSTILEASGPNKNFAILFNIYEYITLPNIKLKAGENNIKLKFKKSTLSEMTCFDNSLASSLNVDYIDMDVIGRKISDSSKIVSIELDPNFTINMGDDMNSKTITVIATYDNGIKRILDESEMDIIKPTGIITTEGSYGIQITLKSDPSKSISKTFEVYYKELTLTLNSSHNLARLEIIDNKPTYILKATKTGSVSDETLFECYDNNVSLPFIKYVLNGQTIELYFDASILNASSNRFYPHLKVDGVNWDKNKGDVTNITYNYNEEEDIYVEYNNLIYYIYGHYSMPTISVRAKVSTFSYRLDTTKKLATFAIKDNKVCYVLRMFYQGNIANLGQFVLFDKTRNYNTYYVDHNLGSFKLYFDITNFPSGDFYPHLKYNGQLIDDENGDVKNNAYAENSTGAKPSGVSIQYNNRTYYIYEQWNMPLIKVV